MGGPLFSFHRKGQIARTEANIITSTTTTNNNDNNNQRSERILPYYFSWLQLHYKLLVLWAIDCERYQCNELQYYLLTLA